MKYVQPSLASWGLKECGNYWKFSFILDKLMYPQGCDLTTFSTVVFNKWFCPSSKTLISMNLPELQFLHHSFLLHCRASHLISHWNSLSEFSIKYFHPSTRTEAAVIFKRPSTEIPEQFYALPELLAQSSKTCWQCQGSLWSLAW